MNYHITSKGYRAKPRVPHNIATWQLVINHFRKSHTISQSAMSEICKHHDHAAGGDAFIPYMLRNQWITVL